jgi:hypothetical protein
MLPKFWSFVHPIIRSFVRSFIGPIHHSSFVHSPYSSFVRSFVQIIFVQPLCYQNSDRSFVWSFNRSFVHSSYSSFVHSPYSSFVRSFVQIIFVQPLCCRNSDRSFVRSFARSFIDPISSFVHSHYSSFSHTTIHHHYSPLLFITVTIYCYYSSLLLFIDDIYFYYSIVTIHHCYSSIIRSPQISAAHPSCCPAHLRPTRPIIQSYELQWLWFSFQ